MQKLYTNVSAAVGAVFSAFIVDSLRAMIPWIMVMMAVIFADLVSGVCKSLKMGIEVSFCRAVRDTLSKCCTYFAVVVCACMVQVAGDYEVNIAKIACSGVLVIEGASIIRNIFRFNGYNIDLSSLFSYIAAKKLGGKKEDFEGIISKDEDKK